MNSITPTSIFQQTNPYESTIQQLLQVDGLKKRSLQNQQEILRTKKTAISDIGSKLTALNSLLTEFENPSGEKLNPLAGQSSNNDAISVLSTTGIKNPGDYNISVTQLAKNDIVLSDEIASDGTTLNTSGNASFTVNVGSDASASIAVDTTNLTNAEVMNAVAEQINDQLGDTVQASVFKLGNGSSQLSFKAVKTGKASRISISNVQGDAAGLNLNNVFTEDSLNAKFTIDSVAFERSSNTVDDAVQGLNFELNQVTDHPEKISITHDIESARKNINSFIDKFNEVNSTIREKTHLNGKTGDHGPLRDERTIRNLSLGLRQDAALPIASMAGQSVQSLADLGIDFKNDGTMYIKNSDKLDNALTSSPETVKQLFSADDGLAAKLQNTIDRAIKGDGNTFDTIKDGIDRKIDRFDDRIATEDKYLSNEEKKLRKQYSDLQQAITQGQSQYNQVLNFRNRIGF